MGLYRRHFIKKIGIVLGMLASFLSQDFALAKNEPLSEKSFIPNALTFKARQQKKGVGRVGDFDLPEDEVVDLKAFLRIENMGPSHPNVGLDMINRGPPGGTPNMEPYNRA